MIYIVSPGRCGTGWLTTCLFTLGLDVVHELYSMGIWGFHPSDRIVWSDTTLVFEYYKLKDELEPKDFVIFLERDSKEIVDSVATLLPGADCEPVLDAYRWLSVDSSNYPCPVLHLHYDNLFELSTAEEIATFLSLDESKCKNVWKYMRDFRITNRKCEEQVKELYDRTRIENLG